MYNFHRSTIAHVPDLLNETILDLSETETYIRPLEVPYPLNFRLMSVASSEAVMEKLNYNREHALLDEMLGEKPASEQVGVMPHEIKFFPMGKRVGRMSSVIQEEAREEGFKTNNGVRSISLEVLPIKKGEFLPNDFQSAARRLGATKFQESPQHITLGWLDLATHSEEMDERRNKILTKIIEVLPVFLLEPIELG